MKKLSLIVLIILIINILGCVSSKYSDETYLDEVGFWAERKENAREYLDAIETGDDEYLMQQYYDGRIKAAPEKITRVAVTGEYEGGKIVEIKFLEGRYKNKVGYTGAEYILDAGKERELDEMAKNGNIEIEKLPSQYQKSYESLLDSGIKIGKVSINSDGHGNYSLVADTNLPYGTRISVCGVETSTGEERISVKLASSPGKKIHVRILGEKDQPRNVILINAALTKNRGDAYGIFGQEISLENL